MHSQQPTAASLADLAVPRSAGRSGGASWRRWFARRWVLWLAVAFFAGAAIPFVRRGADSEWQTCYVRAGQRMLAGQAIHHLELNAYAYPPFMAMCAVPFSLLSPRTSLGLWYAVNVAATMVVVLSAWRLACGTALTGLQGRPAAVFGLASLLSFRFLAAPLENQQFDVVIAALLFVGCRRLARGRDLSAAVWLGLAAAMKCTPLLFAPYLVWRGKLKSACLLALVAVALNRLPDFLFPQGEFPQERHFFHREGGAYLGDWMATFLSKVGHDAPGAWESDLVLNQSLAGLVNRFVQAGVPRSAADIPTSQTVLPPATVQTIRVLVYAACLALVVVTIWRWGRPGRPVQCDDRQTAVEAAMLVCLMLLLSPMSSKAHFVVLVLPILLYSRAFIECRSTARPWEGSRNEFRATIENRPAWLGWLLVPLVICGPLTSKGLTGKVVGDLTLCWGFPTEFVLLLLLAMWFLVRRPLHAAENETLCREKAVAGGRA